MAGKRYLGDAVYADVEYNGDVVLTTEDGIRATNRIVLEPDVIRALLVYLDQSFDANKLVAMLRRTIDWRHPPENATAISPSRGVEEERMEKGYGYNGIELGQTVRDRVTGFYGVVMAIAHFLTGEHRFLVTPKWTPDIRNTDPQWISSTSLEVETTTETVRLSAAGGN